MPIRHFLVASAATAICACGSSHATPPPPLSDGFFGTWGGSTVALFPPAGGDNLVVDSPVVVTVSGNTASISGICLDGSSAMTVTGSGTSASFSGSLTCPTALQLFGCPSFIYRYTQAAVSLTSATSLSIVTRGLAEGCGMTEDFSTTFTGVLAAAGANPVPAWDLRFKGVGKALAAYENILVAGPSPGGDALLQGAGARGLYPWALVGGSGLVASFLYGASQTAFYETSVWAVGTNCQEIFGVVQVGDNVITDFYGDVYGSEGICAIVGVAQPDGGPSFVYLGEEAVPTDQILSGLAVSARTRSFVVTAIFQVDAGLYSYVAESVGALPDGGFEQFDTVIETPTVADLATEAESLADAGYIITASAWQGEAYYTLVGTRPVGSSVSHTSLTMQTTQEDSLADVAAMLSNGYTPVSGMDVYSSLPDGGFSEDAWLIGEK
jgi:hypothetical protein